MTKIPMLVWSKNRACQLDALIRSAKKNFINLGKIIVVCKATSEKFEKGYEKLHKIFPEIIFVKEILLSKDIPRVISILRDKYVLGNSDDNMFIRKVELNDDFYGDSSVIAFSLRLGKNISYCLPAKLDVSQPNYTRDGDFLEWDWTKCDRRTAFGYALPVDSNVYEKSFLQSISRGIYATPTTMENHFMGHCGKFAEGKPKMRSVAKTALVSVCANISSGESPNADTSGKSSLVELNERFLDGERIDIMPFQNIETNAAHMIKPYTFIRG